MVRLVAKERFPYRGSHIERGEYFDETEKHAEILTGTGKCDYAPANYLPVMTMSVPVISAASPPIPVTFAPAAAVPVASSQPASSAPVPIAVSELRDYARRLGIKIDGRWRAMRLRLEIERYRRRDLRAEG